MKIAKIVLLSTLLFGGYAMQPVADTQAQEIQQDITTATVKNNGATISLALTNNSETSTINRAFIQEYRDGQWVEPDYNQYFSILFPDEYYNKETLYYTVGPGGDLPSNGTFRFRIEVKNMDDVLLTEVYTDEFSIN